MAVDMTQYRSHLDALDYPWMGPVSDSELECWLFKPGPNRYHMLAWALCVIDPTFRKHCQHATEEIMEEVVFKALVDYGLCRSTDKDVVAGRASVQKQMLLWNKVVKQCLLMKEWDKKSNNGKSSQPDSFELLTSLFHSRNFWDLLEKKPKLHIVTHPLVFMETLEELQKQLKIAEEDLQEASFSLGALIPASDTLLRSQGEPSGCTSSYSSPPGTPKVERSTADRAAVIAEQRKKIEESYRKITQQLIPAIPKRSHNPAAAQLAEMVKNLAPKLNVFVQFVKDSDEINKLKSSFFDRPMPENVRDSKNNLHLCVSSTLEDISGTLALLRANQDILNTESH